MIELLKMCGYETPEIESELPRIQKAFNKVGIDATDIERGKQRLRKYYDIELKGLRKVLRLCMKELVNALLIRDETNKKIIYGFMSPGIDLLGSALVSKSRDVFSVYHCWAFHIVVGCIFGKVEPIIEEAEKKWLKAGIVAHCANIKTLVGPITTGLFPKPDLLVTAGFMCETAPKTINLLQELYGIPGWYIDTCQDRESNEYPEPSDRIAGMIAHSLRRLTGRIQEVTGFEITDDMLLEVMNAKYKLEMALHRLRELVRKTDPLPFSPTHENIWMCLNSLTLGIDGYTEAAEAINLLFEELQEKVAKGIGVVEKGAPRVMALLPAGQTDPRMEHLACEVGIAIIALDTGLGIRSTKQSEDPYMKYAMVAQQGTMALPLLARVPLIIEGCKRFNVDGVIDRYHVGCRTVSGDALIIEEAIKKELGIPVLTLEWENFDPRAYNEEQLKSRFEIFKAMMKKRHA
ncbi:MAG: 2-hydroxyacyl-CoA dehydratase [Dehalococcoidales bacterium]|nr:2-hydroxyacyl-CoA dehydratase [Dehalococcoidales bacterium]